MNYQVESSLSLYESNFHKLVKWLPELHGGEGQAMWLGVGSSRICIEVLERNPYTSTVQLRHEMQEIGSWTGTLCLKVRIYHDAQVAEVVAYQGIHSFKPYYSYPNPRMLQPREKRRVNQFLGEWLSYFLMLRYKAFV